MASEGQRNGLLMVTANGIGAAFQGQLLCVSLGAIAGALLGAVCGGVIGFFAFVVGMLFGVPIGALVGAVVGALCGLFASFGNGRMGWSIGSGLGILACFLRPLFVNSNGATVSVETFLFLLFAFLFAVNMGYAMYGSIQHGSRFFPGLFRAFSRRLEASGYWHTHFWERLIACLPLALLALVLILGYGG